jgi:uncharacterized protein with PIN domain
VGGRIEHGFRRRFRDVLALVQPRRLEFGVELLVGRAKDAGARQGIPLVRAFAELYEFTRVRVERRLRLTGACSLVSPMWERFREAPPGFLCDASLGGLARWLRASGYAAEIATLAPGALCARARASGRVLLTSDSRLLDRSDVVRADPVVLWIPVSLTVGEQLRMTLRDLGLALREPRCMACGGALQMVAKDAVAARIPPRTALWKDDYMLCAECDHLYWRGTHWDRISQALAASA